MKRKRVLIAHPYAHPSGGGNVVAAWALQALREEFDVTLACLGPVDYAAVNASFGTELREGDFHMRVAPGRYQAMVRCLPTRGALLEACVMMRWAQALDLRERFDVLLGTQNEMDFGRRGIQYVHFPWSFAPRTDIDLRWFHRIPGVLPAYRAFCRLLADGSDEGFRRNLSLANSAFVVGEVRRVHGADAVILYPPVLGKFPEISWEAKRPSIVAVGRMNGCKRWQMAVEIVDRLRAGGVEIDLTLVAHGDDREYGARIAALAASRTWFRILSDLSREDLAREVAAHRYGLHTMEGESFGIAVAELMRAGALPFVHDSGGPVEIVGGLAELRFRDAAEGAARVAAVVRDGALQERLRRSLNARRDCFTEERFCERLRQIVREF